MSPRLNAEQRQQRADRAAQLYATPMNIKAVARELDVSYGTARNLIEQGVGFVGFRPRGTRLPEAET